LLSGSCIHCKLRKPQLNSKRLRGCSREKVENSDFSNFFLHPDFTEISSIKLKAGMFSA
jgi:hypothetical protein